MPSRPVIRYATGARGHLGYWTIGEGPALLSYAPGTMASLTLFDEPRVAYLLRQVATFSAVTFMDRQGLGTSDPLDPNDPPTLERQVEDLLAVMDAAGLDRASVWGSSWDSQAVLVLAATHPDRVEKLVLSSMTPRPLAGPEWSHGLPEQRMAAMAAELEEPGAGHGPGAWGPVLAPSQGDDPALSTWLEEAGRAGPATAQAYFSLMLGTDVRELLPSISAPTLIFHNTGDPFVPVGAARYMADAIPNARLLEHDSPDNVFFTTDLDEKIGELEAFLVTERRSPAQRRLLTVLFTDVVGSTERLSASRDVRWSATLDEIDSTVQRHVRSLGGRVCKSMGDGHLAVFERPSDAVAAGLAIARAVHLLGIDIRAGAHVGEVELRGDDVAGVAVHIGARVSAHAGPGELLVTRTVADLLEGSGHRTELVGDVALKGLPDTWSLYRVR